MAAVHGGSEDELKRRDHLAIDKVRETMAEQIAFWKVLQYFFFRQWKSLKQYVNDKGIDLSVICRFMFPRTAVDVWPIRNFFSWMRI